MKKFLLFIVPLITCLMLCTATAMADADVMGGDPEKSPYFIFGSGSVQGSFVPQETCAYCHGNGGKGTSFGKQAGVPDFTDPKFQQSKTDAQLLETIKAGKDKMPSYRGKQTDEMLARLLQIVRNFGKK
ncbi:MAG: cytochrome c [Candidatus Brocadiales bacterium]|nr:cytochrome c [Candidatus Brocadiales bacterium]